MLTTSVRNHKIVQVAQKFTNKYILIELEIISSIINIINTIIILVIISTII